MGVWVLIFGIALAVLALWNLLWERIALVWRRRDGVRVLAKYQVEVLETPNTCHAEEPVLRFTSTAHRSCTFCGSCGAALDKSPSVPDFWTLLRERYRREPVAVDQIQRAVRQVAGFTPPS